MPTIAPSSSRPYVSRRKRRLVAINSTFGNRSLLALLGLLVVALLVSLSIIATHLSGADTGYTADSTASSTPAPLPQTDR